MVAEKSGHIRATETDILETLEPWHLITWQMHRNLDSNILEGWGFFFFFFLSLALLEFESDRCLLGGHFCQHL